MDTADVEVDAVTAADDNPSWGMLIVDNEGELIDRVAVLFVSRWLRLCHKYRRRRSPPQTEFQTRALVVDGSECALLSGES